MDSLPLELLEYIVDHLFNDNVALKSCSLVEKRWLAPSRQHLFFDLNVRPIIYPKGSALWGKAAMSLDSFIDFLDSAPRLSTWIRELQFGPTKFHGFAYMSPSQLDKSHFIVKTLNSVRSVSFVHISFDSAIFLLDPDPRWYLRALYSLCGN